MGIASIDTDLAIHHVLAALVADQQEALRRGGYHATAYAMLEDAGVLAAAGARSTVPPSTSASGERTAAADLLLRAAWCLYRYAALVAAEVAARCAHPAGPADHAAGAADLLAGVAAALPADSPVRRLCAALRPLLGRLEGYLDEQLTTTDAASTALPVGAAGAEDDIRWLQQLADLLGELDTTADHTFPLGR